MVILCELRMWKYLYIISNTYGFILNREVDKHGHLLFELGMWELVYIISNPYELISYREDFLVSIKSCNFFHFSKTLNKLKNIAKADKNGPNQDDQDFHECFPRRQKSGGFNLSLHKCYFLESLE